VGDDYTNDAARLKEITEKVKDIALSQVDLANKLIQEGSKLERDWKKSEPYPEEAQAAFEKSSGEINVILLSYTDWMEKNKETPFPELLERAEREIPGWGSPEAKLVFLKQCLDDYENRLEVRLPILRSIVERLNESVSALKEIVEGSKRSSKPSRLKLWNR
jgi:hypothetical protein